ncbi:hypothetical protein KDW_64240 [Dictyobacter vulcani]|uniref:Uncharacterized protein n=1 Tax=Dictyobacter vulcani TaxID=2607529 RepID=A0A5J4KYW2_9CHLR|nr:hypothetical protein KDW_64240 [Dictyobacter vulcani]
MSLGRASIAVKETRGKKDFTVNMLFMAPIWFELVIEEEFP